MLDCAINVISLSLAFAMIGLNVYLSSKVLNVPDITCDASVALGGCSYGALVVSGVNPLIAILVAACLGAMAGFVTSSLVTHIKVEPVLAGIVTLTAMQTFISKLAAVNAPADSKTFLSTFPAVNAFIATLIIVLIISFIFYKIMNSEYGLAMRVYGDGRIISESLGIDSNFMLWIGLGLGNALSAIAGALMTQIIRNFDPGMGGGALVFGLAATIIGGKIMSSSTIKATIFGCFVGSFVYKAMIGIVMFSGAEIVGSEYNGVITAITLVFLTASINDSKRRVIHD